jgi:WD40 repeat protein/energy-coupling factor transporter ATP-binding protein EcfA2
MAMGYDVFLSYNSQDKPLVEQIARWLEDSAGFSVWLDRWNLIPGDPWQEEIENALDQSGCCAVFLGPGRPGAWQNEEMRSALDQRVSQNTIRVVPVLLPGAVRPGRESKLPRFLRRLTWVKFSGDCQEPDALHRLACGIKGVTPGRPGGEPRADTCPYRGLEVFREQDHDFFFGREALVQQLTEKLQTARFLAVLGPSGSGKSSVVRAGLMPHLRERALATLFTPGERPLEELAFALRRCYPEDKRPPAKRLLDGLSEPGQSLRYLSREVLEDTGKKELVLVIDQFEELFTRAGAESERRAFILAILNAVEAANGPVTVILTMRSDFLGKCAFYPDLNTYVSDHFLQVGPMSLEELCRAIEEPARLVDLHFEKGLVNRILNDVKGAPGELPLLEHALLELYERRQGSRLTARAYEEIGGIEGALVKRAESEYAKLDDGQREILRKMFVLRLIQPGEGTEDTRRRASRDELLAVGTDSRAAARLLSRWVDARLLTVNSDSLRQQDLVDVAHEALIRKWQRIQAWMDEDREAARLTGILRQAALEWKHAGRNPDYLFQGARLARAEDLLKTHSVDLTGLEKEFVNTGIDLRGYQTKLAEEKRRHELYAARDLAAARAKAVKRARAIIVILLISLLFIIYSLYMVNEKGSRLQKQITMNYWNDSRHARESGREAEAMHLCAKALNVNGDKRLHRALLLDMNSYWNRFALLNIFQHKKAVGGAAFDRGGTRILTWSDDNTVKLWNAGTGEKIAPDLEHKRGALRGAVFNHDGAQVLTWSSDSAARRWDVRTGKKIQPDLTHEHGSLRGAAFNPGGTRILTWGEDGTVRCWNAHTGQVIEPYLAHGGPVLGAMFYHGGQRILTWSNDKTVRRWDARTGQKIEPDLKHGGAVLAAAFTRDGAYILTWSSERIHRRWDARTGELIIEDEAYGDTVNGVTFNRDGTRLLVWHDDFTVRQYAADPNIVEQLTPELVHGDAVLGAIYDSGETRVLTWSADGTARLWDIETGKTVGSDLAHKEAIQGAMFNRDETRVLTWSGDGTARVWKIDTGMRSGPRQVRGMRGKTIRRAAFSRDGARIITWTGHNAVQQWDAGTGEEIPIQPGSDEPVRDDGPPQPAAPGWIHDANTLGAVFNRDKTLIFTWSSDKTARLWDAYTGKQLGKTFAHRARVQGAEFDRSGTRILTWTFNAFRVIDIGVDWDFPMEKIELQVKALTGTALDFDNKKMNYTGPRQWYKLKKEYMEAAGEHYKKCKYRRANVFGGLFPGEREEKLK